MSITTRGHDGLAVGKAPVRPNAAPPWQPGELHLEGHAFLGGAGAARPPHPKTHPLESLGNEALPSSHILGEWPEVEMKSQSRLLYLPDVDQGLGPISQGLEDVQQAAGAVEAGGTQVGFLLRG